MEMTYQNNIYLLLYFQYTVYLTHLNRCKYRNELLSLEFILSIINVDGQLYEFVIFSIYQMINYECLLFIIKLKYYIQCIFVFITYATFFKVYYFSKSCNINYQRLEYSYFILNQFQKSQNYMIQKLIFQLFPAQIVLVF